MVANKYEHGLGEFLNLGTIDICCSEAVLCIAECLVSFLPATQELPEAPSTCNIRKCL